MRLTLTNGYGKGVESSSTCHETKEGTGCSRYPPYSTTDGYGVGSAPGGGESDCTGDGDPYYDEGEE